MMPLIEAAFVLLVVTVAIVSLAKPRIFGEDIYKRRRMGVRARKSNAPRHLVEAGIYQPLEIGAAWREPLEFEATSICPHCGKYDTHRMHEPKPDIFNYRKNSEGEWRPVAHPPWVKQRPLGDHPDACTVRRCRECGHVWGEK